MKLMNAKGVRDFPPEEKILRQEIVDTLKETFEEYGFNPLETPVIERYDLLSSKYAGGDEILKETFKFNDQGKRELGMRYDLTVPFARFVGMNPNLKMPFKRYQIGRVYRDGPIKLGRYREFWQCDVDVVGSKNMMADAELLLIASNAFKKLGLKVTIKINNRKILDGIMEFAGINKNKWINAILSIDKLAKQGKNEVMKELKQKGISDNSVKKIFDTIEMKKTNKETINNLKPCLKKGVGKEGLEDIEELLKYVKNIEFDPSLARGLAYYTGPVFEVFTGGIRSAIAGGGRYDNMISEFLGRGEYPATGISFGLELITDVMKASAKKKSVTKVYVIPIKTPKESLKTAQQLRKAGIKTDLDIVGKGISKNLDFANSQRIPYVLFIGQKELAKKKVKLRNMKTGKERFLPLKDLANKLKTIL